MKRVNFPNNTNDLVEVISPSVRHARYSSKRDFSKTWYQPEEYQSIRMECQMLAEESKESKISKLLDGTTPYHRHIQNQWETQDTLKKKDKEFTRVVARLKIWAVYNRTGRGLEKYIRPETHGLIRQGQIVAHRNAVLYHQDRLMDFCQPDFVAQELATTSVHFSASSSQLAKNMGTADAFAAMTEPNPRHRFIIEKKRSATSLYFEDGRQEKEDGQERKSFLTTITHRFLLSRGDPKKKSQKGGTGGALALVAIKATTSPLPAESMGTLRNKRRRRSTRRPSQQEEHEKEQEGCIIIVPDSSPKTLSNAAA